MHPLVLRNVPHCSSHLISIHLMSDFIYFFTMRICAPHYAALSVVAVRAAGEARQKGLLVAFERYLWAWRSQQAAASGKNPLTLDNNGITMVPFSGPDFLIDDRMTSVIEESSACAYVYVRVGGRGGGWVVVVGVVGWVGNRASMENQWRVAMPFLINTPPLSWFSGHFSLSGLERWHKWCYSAFFWASLVGVKTLNLGLI